MHIQSSQWTTAVAPSDGAGGSNNSGTPGNSGNHHRSTPLRVDAQRNLEHVLRAAREVFGELGYGAPMEDVARRARVGVGTVYRRFPSKDVLVRRIAEEETARLTEQARTALGHEDDPWSALSRFLRTSVASGAGRLLPPSILRVGSGPDGAPEAVSEARVPQQRVGPAPAGTIGPVGTAGVGTASVGTTGVGTAGSGGIGDIGGTGGSAAEIPADLRVVAQRTAPDYAPHGGGPEDARSAISAPGADTTEGGGAQALLDVVGQLVDRARAAGELRSDVTVADVLLVIATAAPSLPDPAQQQAASARLLDILLEGLRSRPGR